MKSKNFGAIFSIHLIIILIAYLSPFLFRWKLILLGVIILYLQELIFKGCVLTHAQFGKDPHMTVYYRYLTLLGFHVNKKKLKFFMAWIMPMLVFLFTLFWQVTLGVRPLIW